jgi:hypothetical protein
LPAVLAHAHYSTHDSTIQLTIHTPRSNSTNQQSSSPVAVARRFFETAHNAYFNLRSPLPCLRA